MTARSAIASVLIFANWSISAGISVADEVSGVKMRREGGVVGHAGGCIAVYQERGGAVHFEIFLVDPSMRLMPTEAYRIVVMIPGKEMPVWEARADNYSAAHRITYGVPPKGFQDQIPPEQLLPGVSYKVVVRSSAAGGIQRVFLHEGTEKRNTCPWDGNPQG